MVHCKKVVKPRRCLCCQKFKQATWYCDSPQSFIGSSDQSRQFLSPLHTLSMLMHSPLRHSNTLGPSHFLTGGHSCITLHYTTRFSRIVSKKWFGYIARFFGVQKRNEHSPEKSIDSFDTVRGIVWGSPWEQPISSLMSLQSWTRSHWRLPWMQVPSLHWNWSGLHVGWAVWGGRERKREREMVKYNRSNDALRERKDGGGRKLVEFPNKTQSLRKEMERHREKKRERRLPSPLTAVDFILTVWTVRVPVTPPVCVNTHAAGAFELLAAARRLGPGGDRKSVV